MTRTVEYLHLLVWPIHCVAFMTEDVIDEFAMIAFWGNRNAFKQFWFRPRVYVIFLPGRSSTDLALRFTRLNKISRVETSTTMLGLPTTLPIWIAPAALARLGHPDGEMNLTRAAGIEGILQGVCATIFPVIVYSNLTCALRLAATPLALYPKLLRLFLRLSLLSSNFM